MAALLFVDFLDELGSGVPVLGAPDIKRELSLHYAGAAWFLLVLPLVLGLVTDVPLLVLSDRWPRRRVVGLGLAAQAIAMCVAALSGSAWTLGLALAVWGAAGGVTNGAAQAALVAAHPTARERILTRWALFGEIGDAAAPALVTGVYALGGSWRGALFTVAALYALHTIVVVLSPTNGSAAPEADDEPEPLGVALRAALRGPVLAWLAATALCTLLDEILVAFGSLWLRDSLGASPALQAAAFTACAIGGALGLVVADRLLARVPARRVLALSACATLVTYAAWIAAASGPLSVVLLALVGFSAAPLYPITLAQAFAAAPGRPGLVAALDHVFAPIEVLAPLAVGLVADHLGLLPALALLALQPVGILATVLATRAPRPKP